MTGANIVSVLQASSIEPCLTRSICLIHLCKQHSQNDLPSINKWQGSWHFKALPRQMNLWTTLSPQRLLSLCVCLYNSQNCIWRARISSSSCFFFLVYRFIYKLFIRDKFIGWICRKVQDHFLHFRNYGPSGSITKWVAAACMQKKPKQTKQTKTKKQLWAWLGSEG